MMFLLTPSTRLIGSTAASIRRKLLTLGVLVMIPVPILGFLVWNRAQQQISRVEVAKRSLPTQMVLLNLNLTLQAHAAEALHLADQGGTESPQRKVVAAAMENAAQAIQETIKDDVVADASRAHTHDTATAIDKPRKLAGRLRSVASDLKTG